MSVNKKKFYCLQEFFSLFLCFSLFPEKFDQFIVYIVYCLRANFEVLKMLSDLLFILFTKML